VWYDALFAAIAASSVSRRPMKRKTGLALIVLGLALGGSSDAAAQVPGTYDRFAYVDISAGDQVQTRMLSMSSDFTLYDETATITTYQRVGSGVFEGGGAGIRVSDNVALGGDVTYFRRTDRSSIVAAIPDPLAFSKTTTSTLGSPDLRRRELTTNITLTWIRPLRDRLDLGVFGGPSFIRLSQDVPVVSIVSGAQPAANTVLNRTGTTIGANAGARLDYAFTKRIAIGFFGRYVYGSVALPAHPYTLDITTNVKVGGVQAGVGARIRL
jgi:hypothetical protein